MTSKATEKLESRKFIPKDEARRLILCVIEAQLKGPDSNDLEDALITKLGEWAEATRFEQERLDQVLSGRLLVRLSTDRRKLEFHAPVEKGSHSNRGPNRDAVLVRDHTTSLSEPFYRPLTPTGGKDSLQ